MHFAMNSPGLSWSPSSVVWLSCSQSRVRHPIKDTPQHVRPRVDYVNAHVYEVPDVPRRHGHASPACDSGDLTIRRRDRTPSGTAGGSDVGIHALPAGRQLRSAVPLRRLLRRTAPPHSMAPDPRFHGRIGRLAHQFGDNIRVQQEHVCRLNQIGPGHAAASPDPRPWTARSSRG